MAGLGVIKPDPRQGDLVDQVPFLGRLGAMAVDEFGADRLDPFGLLGRNITPGGQPVLSALGRDDLRESPGSGTEESTTFMTKGPRRRADRTSDSVSRIRDYRVAYRQLIASVQEKSTKPGLFAGIRRLGNFRRRNRSAGRARNGRARVMHSALRSISENSSAGGIMKRLGKGTKRRGAFGRSTVVLSH